MDNEFKHLKNEIKNIMKNIYPVNTYQYIRNIKEMLVNDLTNENKNKIIDEILLINEFQNTLKDLLIQYDKLTNDIIKYISSIQYEITGHIILNND